MRCVCRGGDNIVQQTCDSLVSQVADTAMLAIDPFSHVNATGSSSGLAAHHASTLSMSIAGFWATHLTFIAIEIAISRRLCILVTEMPLEKLLSKASNAPH